MLAVVTVCANCAISYLLSFGGGTESASWTRVLISVCRTGKAIVAFGAGDRSCRVSTVTVVTWRAGQTNWLTRAWLVCACIANNLRHGVSRTSIAAGTECLLWWGGSCWTVVAGLTEIGARGRIVLVGDISTTRAEETSGTLITVGLLSCSLRLRIVTSLTSCYWGGARRAVVACGTLHVPWGIRCARGACKGTVPAGWALDSDVGGIVGAVVARGTWTWCRDAS